jgi:hypothetical protein
VHKQKASNILNAEFVNQSIVSEAFEKPRKSKQTAQSMCGTIVYDQKPTND